MKNLDILTASIIAHRGYYDNEKNIPENSLKAFRRAIDLGYTIEVDVHILKDNELVVFHDDHLKRMTGRNRFIKDCDLNEIRKYKLKNTSFHIPTLKEVLTLVDGKVPLIIELKYDVLDGRLQNELIKLLDTYEGAFAVKSFHPLLVRWFYQNRPQYIRGQLVSHVHKTPKEWLVWSLITNYITKPDFLSCHYTLLDAKRIKRFRKKKNVLTWTIKERKQYDDVFNKADNYICENMEHLFRKK